MKDGTFCCLRARDATCNGPLHFPGKKSGIAVGLPREDPDGR